MRRLSLALGLLVACAATAASAETVNLTGTYRCIQMCRNGMLGAPTFVTQNGQAVNLTTETGESYRAWPDWSAPYSRIWIDARGEGAVYSPDGFRRRTRIDRTACSRGLTLPTPKSCLTLSVPPSFTGKGVRGLGS